MARAENFEEWSGELSDPNAWIVFADGRPTQTPMQVFTGWVNHIVRPLVQPLIDRTARLEAEVSNLRAAELGYTRTIEELEDRVNELEGEDTRLKSSIDSLIDDVNAGDTELNSRIDSILRVDQQYAMLTTLLSARQDRIPAEAFIDTPQAPPVPNPTPAPEPQAAAAPPPVVVAASPAPPPVPPATPVAQAQITDDNVRDMCDDVCAELDWRKDASLKKKMLKEGFLNRGKSYDELKAIVKDEYHANMILHKVFEGCNFSEEQRDSHHSKVLSLAWAIVKGRGRKTLEQAIEEMKNPPVVVKVVENNAGYNKAKSDLEAAATQLGLDLSKVSVQTFIEENIDELAPLALNNQDAEYLRRISIASGTLAKMK